MNPKKSPLILIKQFFGLSLQDAKAEKEKMSEQDVIQLGSAIGREMGLKPEEMSFVPVEY